MIEITVVETGDSAQAETPEDALFAARTIGEEARQHRGIWGFDPTLRFECDGQPVRLLALSVLS